MKLRPSLVLAFIVVAACGDDESSASGGGGAGTSSATTASGPTSGTPSSSGPGSGSGGDGAGGAGTPSSSSAASASGGGGEGTGAGAGSGGGGASEPGEVVVGEWDDEPGACPEGTTVVEITRDQDLAEASRGEGDYEGQGPGTCYFIRDGVYTSSENVLLYIHDRAASVDDPIWFVGESRDGVVIHHRTTIENSSGIVLENMTFDLTGYDNDDAFNTLSLEAGATGIRVRNVTFTGDCATGLQGGHIETADDSVTDVVVTRSIIEKYGQCNGVGDLGHLDHGVYIAAGRGITLHNNIIRENSSRGIQIYTQNGDYGSVSDVEISNNLIVRNGHEAYEDGIVINGAGTGPVDDVRIRHNVIAENFYSGVRFGTGDDADADISGIVIERNTFFDNGESSGEDGSDISEDIGSGVENVEATLTRNIFVPAAAVIDSCMPNVTFADNIVQGSFGDESCQGDLVDVDPELEDPSGGRYRPQNPDAAGYGAYSEE